MKIIGVVTLVLGIASILSYGPGVPTQGVSTSYKPEILEVTDGNNGAHAPVAAPTSSLNPPHGSPGHRCDIPVGKPLYSEPIKPASRFVIPAATILPIMPADGLNPKHGQPGHRCDIAVGQPLNSKPPVQSPSRSASMNTSFASSNATGTPPLLNPEHGQPFHRCDIKVGQPLNSKPTIPAIQTANAITATTTASNTTKAPLLNPKHGQPFHRCDIMVGQPLNSKPTLPPILQNISNTPSPAVTPLRTSATKAPLLNPKHGQPGHRCDILVGQPLNGKPAFTLPVK